MGVLRKAILLAVAFVLAVAPARAKELFVDLNRPDDSGSGMTEEDAFKTIKAAVAKADQGDIITVLPGIYRDEYDVDGYGYTNRVYLRKAVHLRSKKGAQETVILGRHDPATDSNGTPTAGVGSGAIRCVLGVQGAIVQGFTLADGAGHTEGADLFHSWAGGAVPNSTGLNFYLVDSVITNCTGYRGGAVRYTTAVRCRFTKNYGKTGNLARDIVAVNCLIDKNGKDKTVGYITDSGTAKFYNCTIVANNSLYAHSSARLYNCVETLNASTHLTYSQGSIVVTNSVLSCLNKGTTKPLVVCEKSRLNPVRPQFIASAFNDWGVVDGADAEGMGDASLLDELSLPESIDPYLDIEGKSIPKTGPIQAGCFQRVVKPAGGAVVFSSQGLLNGYPIPCAWASAYPVEYPAQWRFKAGKVEGEEVFCYYYAGQLTFPLLDDSLAFMPPSDENLVVTNIVKTTSKVFYVDANNGNDTNNGLSKDSPFKTLQKVVSAATVANTQNFDASITVAIAAAGEYGEGGELGGGVTNRIYSTDKRIRFKGPGRDLATIRGKHDPDSPSGDGRGPKAHRCAYISGFECAIQGFTLSDGACSYRGDGTDATADQLGGAVYSSSVHILDCTIFNGSAYRGAAFYNSLSQGRLSIVRSRIIGCTGGNGLTFKVRHLGNLIYGNNASLRGEDSARHCTIYAADGMIGAISDGTMATNCVAREGAKHILGSGSTGVTGGSVLHGFNRIYTAYAEKSNSIDDPQFSNPEDSDFRLKSTSPALQVGVFDDDYWKNYTLDVDCRETLFFDGKPLAGAVQVVRQVVAPPACDFCIIEPSAERVVDPGETVTWTASGFTRPPLGFATNGVPVGSDSVSCVYDGTPVAGAANMGVSYLFGTNWYVNAEFGSDDNTGFTIDSPKRTLSSMMSVETLAAGDTVHLAQGVYSNGLMGTAGTTDVSNRVVVTKAIALVGDGDASQVVVEGADSPNPTFTDYEYNLGPGAVRCGYFIGSGATVRNITFRNGRTAYRESSANIWPCHGGGVAASQDVVFEDCVFVSNRACRAAGAWGGTFRRCRFDGNWACSKGGHLMLVAPGTGADCYNCYFGVGFGVPIQGAGDVGDMAGCFFDKFYRHDGAETWGIVPSASKLFVNNILLCPLNRPIAHVYPSNCVYVSVLNSQGADYFHPVNCIQKTLAEVKAELDPHTGRILSRSSWLVDAGATEYAAKGGESDLGGSQRVYNGAVDIGPFEYDWRERFSSLIGGGARVSHASPFVIESADGLALSDGATIGFTVPGREIKGVSVSVAEGVLSASGGRADETIVSDSVYRVAGAGVLDLHFAFAGAGSAVIRELVRKPGVQLIVR